MEEVGSTGSWVALGEGTAGGVDASIHGDGSSVGGCRTDWFQSVSLLRELPFEGLGSGQAGDNLP